MLPLRFGDFPLQTGQLTDGGAQQGTTIIAATSMEKPIGTLTIIRKNQNPKKSAIVN